MKKSKAIFAVAFSIIMLTSCVKTYTCTCNYKSGSYSSTYSGPTITTSKKSLAKTACENQSPSANGIAKTCSVSKF